MSTATDEGRTRLPRHRVESWNFRDQAVGILRQQILDGTYASGSRLNEVEIADAMGISRGPLREALQRLVAEGLVEMFPHRGAFVRSFTSVELDQMYEFREIVESGAARLAAARASQSEVEGLREMLAETEHLLQVASDASYPASPDFHRRILELSHNPSLRRAGTDLQTQVRIARQSSARNPGRARAAFEEHREIAEAIARRDPKGAGEAMTRHLANSLSSARSGSS